MPKRCKLLQDIRKPIEISEYELTNALPDGIIGAGTC